MPTEPSSQLIFNIMTFIAGGAVTWWVKTIWASVTKLQQEDAVLAEKVHQIELVVTGDYAKKDELLRMVEQFMKRMDVSDHKIEKRLDSIDSKLDNKQDKIARPYQ